MLVTQTPPLAKPFSSSPSCGTLIVRVQQAAFSHQLYEQIQKDMLGDKVDHFASASLNFLFLLKADC